MGEQDNKEFVGGVLRTLVTPSEKSQSQSSKDGNESKGEEASTAWADETDETNNSEFNRKTLSKSKRVKSYIQKKCRDVEVKVRSRSKSGSRNNTSANWFLNQETPEDVVQDDSRTEGGTPSTSKESEEKEVEVEVKDNEPELTPEQTPEIKLQKHEVKLVDKKAEKEDDSDTASEGTLLDETQSDMLLVPLQGKWDVGCLVDKYFGQVYPQYFSVRAPLVREARDLLVTKFFGDTERFELEFCVPASGIARSLAVSAHKQVLDMIRRIRLRQKIRYEVLPEGGGESFADPPTTAENGRIKEERPLSSTEGRPGG